MGIAGREDGKAGIEVVDIAAEILPAVGEGRAEIGVVQAEDPGNAGKSVPGELVQRSVVERGD